MPIPYGVIGTGWITDSWIAEASKTGQWQLAAVYSRQQTQAEAYGKKHHCSNLHTSLHSLVSDKSIEAVYIASPNSLHYAQTKQMLTAKKHVVLEKPATPTLRELEELFDVARENGVFLIEAYRHVQYANFKKLRDMLVHEKRLGDIYGASLSYASYSGRYTSVLNGDVPNIFKPEFCGGSLLDVGVYPVTFAVTLFGRPKAQLYVPYICRTGVDAGGVAILQYDSFGVQINVSKCYTSAAPSEIYCERGTMTVNSTVDLSSLKLFENRTKQTQELAGVCMTAEKPGVSMQEEAAEFARIILHGDEGEAKRLEAVSKIVVEICEDMRRQGGIRYPGDSS